MHMAAHLSSPLWQVELNNETRSSLLDINTNSLP